MPDIQGEGGLQCRSHLLQPRNQPRNPARTSSSSPETHCRCTGRLAVVCPRSEHFSASCSVSTRSTSSRGTVSFASFPCDCECKRVIRHHPQQQPQQLQEQQHRSCAAAHTHRGMRSMCRSSRTQGMHSMCRSSRRGEAQTRPPRTCSPRSPAVALDAAELLEERDLDLRGGGMVSGFPSRCTVLKWLMMEKWLFMSVPSTSSITSCRGRGEEF